MAGLYGVISPLLRRWVLQQEAEEKDRLPDTSNLAYHIKRIGKNINQLVKIAHHKNLRSPNSNLERETIKSNELLHALLEITIEERKGAIGKIIYGETCKGTLSYVFGKEGRQVLVYGNTFSQSISQKFFGSLLHFQGPRNATKNRYAHISLNPPHGKHLDDKTFYKISEEYKQEMGYGERPYVVVRHNDTKHEHVHIVTTTVKENGKVLGIFNNHRRSMATRQHLEKKYGLSPAPPTKQKRQLQIYRLPELQFGMDAEKGTKYYLQDVLNGINQKYKVRSFEELARLVKPYPIEVRQTKNESGRIGVKFGLDNQKGYRTRFILGSEVHRDLSGPKLQKVFDIHSRSKLLPLHGKRLLKQVKTGYDLFQTIHPHDLEDVFKEYQDIDITGQERRSYRGIYHL